MRWGSQSAGAARRHAASRRRSRPAGRSAPRMIPEFGDRGLAGVGITLRRAVDRLRHTDRQPGPRVGQPPRAWTAPTSSAVAARRGSGGPASSRWASAPSKYGVRQRGHGFAPQDLPARCSRTSPRRRLRLPSSRTHHRTVAACSRQSRYRSRGSSLSRLRGARSTLRPSVCSRPPSCHAPMRVSSQGDHASRTE